MPYSGPDDPGLPDNVKKLSKEKRNHWAGAWNGAFKQYKDEGRAFAVANAAIKEADTRYYLEESENVEEAELTRKSINDLPDSDFAYIEPGGEKDDGGKTVPRSLRHFPIHDEAHVRNALARAPQSPFGDKAMPKIKAAARRLKIGEVAESEEIHGISEAATVAILESGAVEVTIIKPGWSGNGHYYPPEVLARAVPKFEGLAAYMNHPTKTELRERPGRDLRDLVGYYESVHIGPNGEVKGLLNLMGTNGDMLRPLIKEVIEKKPDLVGISINAGGKKRLGMAEGRKGEIIEDLTRVYSSDIVTMAAAGGQFERLVATGDWLEELIKDIPAEQLRRLRPELATEVNMEMTTEIQEQVKGLVEAAVAERLKPLQEELDQTKVALEQAGRRESAREKLKASPLPEAIHADLMEALSILDAEGQDKAIEAEVAKIKKLNLKPNVQGTGQGNTTPGPTLLEQASRKVFRISSEAPKPDETVWEYRERIKSAAQA